MQEIAEQPEKNAFEALKKPRNRKNEKQKPLKTVTNTRSAPAVTKTKQPKIYDESNGRKSLAGSKKIEMRYLLFNYQSFEISTGLLSCNCTQGDLTPNFPTFAKPILNLDFNMNADPGSI